MKRAFEIGPYSEFASAQERAMKVRNAGGTCVFIDKKKGKWWISYTAENQLH